ncbi:MAG TPA: hypothetical protein VK074_04125, partial [Fodinibius sp.]|nr:hypothetical protein [Fodinibius sp.]
MLNKTLKWGVVGPYILCVLALTVVLNGCDGFLQVGNKFLEKAPGADVTKDTVFSNATYANELLVHAYESLHDGLGGQGAYYTGLLGDQSTLQALTDIGQDYNSNNGGPSVYYYTGSYSADVEEDDQYRVKFHYKYGATWAGMRDAYIFLENVDQVPDMDQQIKEQRKGEALMNIATRYVRMFRNYGGMIWIDHAYGPNEDFQLPRLTAK